MSRTYFKVNPDFIECEVFLYSGGKKYSCALGRNSVILSTDFDGACKYWLGSISQRHTNANFEKSQ